MCQRDMLVILIEVTRFIIGMCMWVSRWCRPAEGDTRGGDRRRSNVANPVVAVSPFDSPAVRSL
jgi:hypothetical protein